MSVLIKGIKMPSSCIECPCSLNLFFCKVYSGMSVLDASSLTINGTTINVNRPDWCPLVELTEHHGRIIDEDQIIVPSLSSWADQVIVADAIMDAPTIIEAE